MNLVSGIGKSALAARLSICIPSPFLTRLLCLTFLLDSDTFVLDHFINKLREARAFRLSSLTPFHLTS